MTENRAAAGSLHVSLHVDPGFHGFQAHGHGDGVPSGT